jgi:hypothetical protein
MANHVARQGEQTGQNALAQRPTLNIQLSASLSVEGSRLSVESWNCGSWGADG